MAMLGNMPALSEETRVQGIPELQIFIILMSANSIMKSMSHPFSGHHNEVHT